MQLINPNFPETEVHHFLKEWFRIDPLNESLEIVPFELEGKELRNRYVVRYTNKVDFYQKKYYIDFNYLNDMDDGSSLDNPIIAAIDGTESDSAYNKVFQYTRD